ncbi:MAG: cystathionine beta-lyase [Betaproteobacteria bacterium]|nr:cystathionine beta-lyase [Betaproteobacteria bacterium]MBU6511266.1 cystathionine beta-lyase [Betaproteobacteria bacterium]MDE1954308.1 cystathionine beta-lyase [Betaproteobacteria bacterium]MDE2152835.1 cystathionine beta-lyase [Betaproteobacteria bacterium]
MTSQEQGTPGAGAATLLQHHPYRAPEGFAGLQLPVYRASTVLFDNVRQMRERRWRDKSGYTYGLHGTPASFALERRLADIEGARHALLCPSGLSAIALVDLALLRQGDEVLLPCNAYAPGRELAQETLAAWGISTRIYDPLDPASLRERIGANTRLLWLEAPGSVSMEVPDLRALVALAREAGVLTAIDNTWSAGLALQPFELGIDVSMQALTKYQSGGADVLMGAVLVRDDALHDALLDAHMRLGLGVGGDDVGLLLRGLSSMPLRYAAHDASARRVAEWLLGRPEVERVLHPALPGSPGHAYWLRDFRGAAGLFSVVLRPEFEPARVDAFVDALRLFGIGYSWGGPMSLAVPYDLRHARAAVSPPVGSQAAAVPAEAHYLVRLNIGLERPEDLIADLEQALRAALSPRTGVA